LVKSENTHFWQILSLPFLVVLPKQNYPFVVWLGMLKLAAKGVIQSVTKPCQRELIP